MHDFGPSLAALIDKAEVRITAHVDTPPLTDAERAEIQGAIDASYDCPHGVHPCAIHCVRLMAEIDRLKANA